MSGSSIFLTARAGGARPTAATRDCGRQGRSRNACTGRTRRRRMGRILGKGNKRAAPRTPDTGGQGEEAAAGQGAARTAHEARRHAQLPDRAGVAHGPARGKGRQRLSRGREDAAAATMAPDEGRRCGREEEGAPARCMMTDGGLEGGGERRSCLVRCMTGGADGGAAAWKREWPDGGMGLNCKIIKK
ncbi:hypothetical protein GQ55_3G120500 [Panicum hallii var. hallii]|uniref:Uncharacterized protein n=1 Tax=Panicum hallii var. hallii TaxID=1504633 RepID=A0A2T7E8J8_9POAL|nr:hypothetical protein GQ55_3G120500 [Panicum hallii var. hallii]